MTDIFVSCKHTISTRELEIKFLIASCLTLELRPRTFQHKILDGFISTIEGYYLEKEKEEVSGRLLEQPALLRQVLPNQRVQPWLGHVCSEVRKMRLYI